MRQFVTDAQFSEKGTLTVKGDDYHHIVTVARAKVGDALIVSSGGEVFDTTICAIDKKTKTLTLQLSSPLKIPKTQNSKKARGSTLQDSSGQSSQLSRAGGDSLQGSFGQLCQSSRIGGSALQDSSGQSSQLSRASLAEKNPSQSSFGQSGLLRGAAGELLENTFCKSGLLSGQRRIIDYTLFIALPRAKTLEAVVDIATQCGVKSIVPVVSNFSQKDTFDALTKGRALRERLKKLIRSAREQSGSPIDTSFESDIASLSDINKMAEGELAIALWERSSTGRVKTSSIAQAFFEYQKARHAQAKSVAILVGSEGGFGEEEIEALTNFFPCHLNTPILRTQVAVNYGLAAVQSLVGVEWS